MCQFNKTKHNKNVDLIRHFKKYFNALYYVL
jgi:hypothetical protein